jgi:hypothetical protein
MVFRSQSGEWEKQRIRWIRIWHFCGAWRWTVTLCISGVGIVLGVFGYIGHSTAELWAALRTIPLCYKSAVHIKIHGYLFSSGWRG